MNIRLRVQIFTSSLDPWVQYDCVKARLYIHLHLRTSMEGHEIHQNWSQTIVRYWIRGIQKSPMQ